MRQCVLFKEKCVSPRTSAVKQFLSDIYICWRALYNLLESIVHQRLLGVEIKEEEVVCWKEELRLFVTFFVLSHAYLFWVPFISCSSQLRWPESVGYHNLETSYRTSSWQALGARGGQGENKLLCPMQLMNLHSEKATCSSLTHSTKKSRQILTWKIPGKWLSPTTIAYFCLLTLPVTTGTLTLMLWAQESI